MGRWDTVAAILPTSARLLGRPIEARSLHLYTGVYIPESFRMTALRQQIELISEALQVAG